MTLMRIAAYLQGIRFIYTDCRWWSDRNYSIRRQKSLRSVRTDEDLPNAFDSNWSLWETVSLRDEQTKTLFWCGFVFFQLVEINRPPAGSDKSQQVEEFTGENSSGAKSQRLPGCHPAVCLLWRASGHLWRPRWNMERMWSKPLIIIPDYPFRMCSQESLIF